MANSTDNKSVLKEAIPHVELKALGNILWGVEIKHDVFRRWTQGFCWGEEESSALVQHEGGPCAVIVPVQAFLLKHILFGTDQPSADWRQISGEARDQVLAKALLEVFLQLDSAVPRYCIVTSQPPETTGANGLTNGDSESTSQGQTSEDAQSSPKKKCFSHEQFHHNLRCTECSTQQELEDVLNQNLTQFKQDNGLLMFLYSILLSKGIEQVKNEMEDPSEALIDPVHGHGSQSLINLLLTGKASSHVFDNERNISGLKLQGISKRSRIGFLTFLEHLRYLEVGWYLKNPEYPIWLLGSETHLTIIFSQDRNLVCTESPESQARRIFTDFDTEGSGFVASDRLGDLMAALDLENHVDYVKIVLEKLDPEQLGIVTLQRFLEEFYPGEGNQPDTVTAFQVFHYNGLPRSCPENKVKYKEGSASLKDYIETQFVTDTSQIKDCLRTKWPTIELTWNLPQAPSLN